jgi:hypothetical protein
MVVVLERTFLQLSAAGMQSYQVCEPRASVDLCVLYGEKHNHRGHRGTQKI